MSSRTPAAPVGTSSRQQPSASSAIAKPQYEEDDDEEYEEYEEVVEEIIEEEVEEDEEEEDVSADPHITGNASRSPQPRHPNHHQSRQEGEVYEVEGSDEEYEEFYEDEEEEVEEVDQQEDLMNFMTFPISSIKGHHIMFVAAYQHFIYVGTNQGVVALLDETGAESKRFQHHMDPISDICCDEKENFFASADKAGVVSAQNIWDESEFFRKEFDHPIQAVAIHPRYGLMDDRPIVCGGSDKVLLITKTIFLGNRKTTTLQERQGKIHAIRWCKDVIAWANDRGITLYSYSSKNVFANFARPENCPKADLYRCNMFWESPSSLVVGWADWVPIISVKECTVEERVRKNELTKHHKAELENGFRTGNGDCPYRICGLAPFGDDKFLVLAAIVEVEGLMNELEIRIVSRSRFADEFRGSMHMKHRHPMQFGLSHLKSSVFLESVYYVVSVDSVLKATPCDDDDHVEHLLRNQRYQEAYDYAKTIVLKRRTMDEIGRNLLDHLVDVGQFEKAAAQFSEILGTSDDTAGTWEKWVQLYDQKHETEILVHYLPHYEGNSSYNRRLVDGPKLKPQYYELVLNRCLEADLLLFKEAVRRFDGLFTYETVANAVESRYAKMRKDRTQGKTVNEAELRILGETYGLLLEQQDKNNEALSVLMEIKGSADLFEFIRKKALFTKACSILPDLFEKSEELTLKLLLDHLKADDTNELDPLNPEAVLKRLETAHRTYLWKYIKTVQHADKGVYHQICRRHAQLIALMFADHEPAGLLGFLKDMFNYLTKMKEIHSLCKQRGYLEEMVFLMARMGKQEEGLRIIVEDMKNVQKAIDFIKDFNTDEEQIELFKKLVDFVQQMDDKLQGQRGHKFFDHLVQDGDTWEGIAKKYGVKEIEVRSLNNATSAATSTLPRPHVRVPMNMLAALLTAVSDPSVSEQTAIDPIYLIKYLPPNQHIPNIGESLSRIARSKAAHKALMETLMRVLNGDIGELQRRLHRSRSRAIRIDPQARFCYYCNEMCIGTNVVSFHCTHTFHPKCVVDYLAEDGTIRADSGTIEDPDEFVADPNLYLKQKQKGYPLHCRVCMHMDDDSI
jgi:vacuolar protein sorting-associated protein 41